MDIFSIPMPALMSQLTLGLVQGGFYAMLSLGLAVIFGMLGIINFAHGALYMLGAVLAYIGLSEWGLGFWTALFAAPLIIGLFGMAIERWLLRFIRGIDHVYGLLLTFGLALIIEGLMRQRFGVSGLPYAVPEALRGVFDFEFMVMPKYRVFALVISILVCLLTWWVIEKTRLGSTLRAATEKPALTQAFGINVPLLVTLTYGFGVALAALAGVLAAPTLQVSPLMGSNLIIVVFAVVVIGGMGSILGAIVTGFGLGLIEGLCKVVWPEASSTVVFAIMALVLLLRPAGLFGKEQ